MTEERNLHVRRMSLAGCALFVLCVGAALVAAQERPPQSGDTGPASSAIGKPLPDADAFLAEARKHLERDSSRQSGYSYVEKRRNLKLDGRNTPVGESVKV